MAAGSPPRAGVHDVPARTKCFSSKPALLTVTAIAACALVTIVVYDKPPGLNRPAAQSRGDKRSALLYSLDVAETELASDTIEIDDIPSHMTFSKQMFKKASTLASLAMPPPVSFDENQHQLDSPEAAQNSAMSSADIKMQKEIDLLTKIVQSKNQKVAVKSKLMTTCPCYGQAGCACSGTASVPVLQPSPCTKCGVAPCSSCAQAAPVSPCGTPCAGLTGGKMVFIPTVGSVQYHGGMVGTNGGLSSQLGTNGGLSSQQIAAAAAAAAVAVHGGGGSASSGAHASSTVVAAAVAAANAMANVHIHGGGGYGGANIHIHHHWRARRRRGHGGGGVYPLPSPQAGVRRRRGGPRPRPSRRRRSRHKPVIHPPRGCWRGHKYWCRARDGTDGTKICKSPPNTFGSCVGANPSPGGGSSGSPPTGLAPGPIPADEVPSIPITTDAFYPDE